MKKISIGYFELQEGALVSDIAINRNFLELLGRYANITVIPISAWAGLKENFKKIKEYKLDYLYINSFCFLPASFLLREKLSLDIPFILNLHTVFSWGDEYMHIIPLIRKYDIIIASCRYAKESFLRITDKFDVRIVPRFFDIKFIQKNISFRLNKHKKVITFMGRLTERKGIEALIKCMPEISAQVSNAHLNIIGPLSRDGITDYPKHPYVKKLEREVRKLGLTGRVCFKGMRSGLDKYKILSESDIFVNPTTAKEEALSSVNIEALACGLAVIASDWAGNKEIVKDGENGFLFNVINGKNKEAKIDKGHLVSLIVKVLKDKKLNLYLRKNAARLAGNYDYRKVVPRLLRFLKGRKKNSKIKSKWGIIKDKRVIDFSRFFRKDFLFFLYYCNSTRTEDYLSFYKRIIEMPFSKNRYYPAVEKIKNREAKETVYKVTRNCFNFLTFGSK